MMRYLGLFKKTKVKMNIPQNMKKMLNVVVLCLFCLFEARESGFTNLKFESLRHVESVI